GALGQSASPRLARYFISDRGAYRKLLGRMALISLGLGSASIMVAVFLGRPILALIYGAEYAEYQGDFAIIAVAGAVQLVASPFGYAMTAARAFRMQAVIVTLTCLVTGLASLWLVPRYEVTGASLAVVATAVCMLVGFAIGVWIQLQKALVPDQLNEDTET
ncbi:MAG: lipopolysaccharide biosynthesis protein, partial [Phycisphaerae bacterium]